MSEFVVIAEDYSVVSLGYDEVSRYATSSRASLE